MDAPEYIFLHMVGPLQIYTSFVNEGGNGIEYVHKETLLNWLKEKRFETPGNAEAYQEVIDKLNQL